jgi:hypothetical protein
VIFYECNIFYKCNNFYKYKKIRLCPAWWTG